MENSHTDELYEILDELNARVEDVMNECDSSESCDLFISKLREKVYEFMDDLHEEVEKISAIEAES